MMMDVYGIKNCDTVKKSLKWLHANDVEITFHDLKKETPNSAQIIGWAKELGWDKLINKRGTSWRKLSEEQKSLTDDNQLAALVVENTSLIKRPLIVFQGTVQVGFNPDEWQRSFL